MKYYAWNNLGKIDCWIYISKLEETQVVEAINSSNQWIPIEYTTMKISFLFEETQVVEAINSSN